MTHRDADGARKWMLRAMLLGSFLLGAAPALAEDPPARPGIDAPELARLGSYAVGFTTLTLRQPDQLDPLQGEKTAAPFTRELPLRVWYPATHAGTALVYRSALPGPDGNPVAFTIQGIASADAPAAPGSFPLVLLAHGGSNTPEVMAWLAENLATKGYVVAAPDFGDPPITERAKFIFPIARRPLDIAFAVAEIRRRAARHEAPFGTMDGTSVALVGYSMGGYGVLTAAGASLDGHLAEATRGALDAYVAGAGRAKDIAVPAVSAVVAIAPPRHLGPLEMWAPGGLDDISAPTFLIVGSQDPLVGYEAGVRVIFEQEIHAPRYLLTFREAGHNIAMSGAPSEMQGRLWDKDWFEDPVWRKPRLMAIEAHFITAFLDKYLKHEATRGAYLDGLVPNSNDGAWPGGPHPYGSYSPGVPDATLWKGFQERHANGMLLEFRPAAHE